MDSPTKILTKQAPLLDLTEDEIVETTYVEHKEIPLMNLEPEVDAATKFAEEFAKEYAKEKAASKKGEKKKQDQISGRFKKIQKIEKRLRKVKKPSSEEDKYLTEGELSKIEDDLETIREEASPFKDFVEMQHIKYLEKVLNDRMSYCCPEFQTSLFAKFARWDNSRNI